jgi:hypothetical protein
VKTKSIGMRFKWIGVLAIATAAVVGLAISPAIGASGFLTQKKGVKLFFTKKQANKLFLTKKAGSKLVTDATVETDKKIAAATAGLVSKAQADSSYLPSKGSFQLQVSPTNWVAASTGTVDYSTAAAGLDSTGAVADRFFNAALTIPAVLAGRPVSLTSFELCYNTLANATIDRVFLFTNTPTSADVSPIGTTPIDDEADRTDAACRTYAGAAPIPIGPTTLTEIVVRNDYAAASSVTVTRLTVNLST